MAIDTSKLQNLKKKSGKGAPPPPAEAPQNLIKPESGAKVPLQLKISPEIRREFRVFATERDLELSELFIQMWEFYKNEHAR